MKELRVHGRGGQGVVVLTKLVARLFFQRGVHVKEFPKFGVERRGAPVEGFVRTSEAPIDLNCQVYHPDTLVVMGEAILEHADVTVGVAPGALVLVDSARSPEALGDRLAGLRVATVDASGIALAHGLGSPLAPIANTTLFGALARLLGADPAELEPALAGELKRPGVNVEAARAGFAAVSAPVSLPGDVLRRPVAPLPYATLAELPLGAHSSRDALGNRTGRWRSSRPVYAFKRAPCADLCPAGNDVRGFVAALAAGETERALRFLLETSPLPGVCGRVCPHPCERECNRAAIDAAISVNALERFAADHGGLPPIECAASTGRSVAVVGAGPAGLSAAWQLARLGHRVVVLESAAEPGGMLVQGIPAYRLPRAVVAAEISRLVALGVELRCGIEVGRDLTLAELGEDHDAVIVAVGQGAPTALDLPGTEHALFGLDLLRRFHRGEEIPIGRHAVVIGGGNAALDAAGVVLRRQREQARAVARASDEAPPSVRLVYRRTRTEMPALAEEVDHAIAEGVALFELTAPVEVRHEGGRVVGLVCERMRLAAPDASGRPRPVPIPGTRHEVPCDQVIVAVGQRARLAFAAGVELAADALHTNRGRLYLCGDCATGDGTVAAAIGRGRAAAFAAHTELGLTSPARDVGWAPQLDQVLRAERIQRHAFDPATRAQQARLAVEERLDTWHEVVQGLADAVPEARRCVSCGACTGCDRCLVVCPEPAVARADGVYRFDLDFCKGCGVCGEECPRGVIDMQEERA